jgi:hypothetical protein
MNIKPVVAISFDARTEPDLIAKLNAVAPYCHKKAHTVCREILTEKLDEIIRVQGININAYYARPT